MGSPQETTAGSAAMTVLSKRFFPPIIKALKPRRHVRQTGAQLNSSTDASQNTVPSEADVVTIGGGSLGCQTLYHLAKMGVTNTVLLEKDQLTAGREQVPRWTKSDWSIKRSSNLLSNKANYS